MEIRKATEKDIPAIVELLRLSLGEGLIKKSEEAWRWKHIENPFGESPVLVAEENDQLIGVRAMMQWSFELNGRIYRAVRAVDTATHPEHQGRGVFKKLTLALIDQLTAEGYDFIFNTPNAQSKPGYLKMGWNEIYNVPIRIKPKLLFGKQLAITDYEINEATCLKLNGAEGAYVHWRYKNNPLAKYYQLSFDNGFAFFRIKEGKYFNELRICDIYAKGDFAKPFKKALHYAMNSFKARLASVGHYQGTYRQVLGKAGFLPKMDRGLSLTARSLNTNPEDYFLQKGQIDLDLGTFELF
ncbi:acetyltransferase (GNAT) family protein [Roseivirga pacifica]|uniref:Acetyltransferase (GNAT) domain-containing protein n=1 Tax=Roseivirga pacifica TaxID=1267423 RepID=A0A1I0QYW3_9BACT|nr:GNAT family N-acetyltransferase [Roseivirga pacifica]RKQ42313.1 acetyltransferase (GNAT) family protein [Roseivirga pacifica]SEW33110.1 Acetyltransferase (GNAT) domain-containing protein [Roseivirga pacifica]